jgi:hypothetical protein
VRSEFEAGTLKMLATFNMTRPDDHVEYSLWMSSSSDAALDFIEDFQDIAAKFADDAAMTPHYSFEKCTDCGKDYTDEHCFGGGKYCAHDTNHESLKGRDIILEDLRELCIFKRYEHEDRMLWWRYMRMTHETCYGDVAETCSKDSHDRLDIDWAETQ